MSSEPALSEAVPEPVRDLAADTGRCECPLQFANLASPIAWPSAPSGAPLPSSPLYRAPRPPGCSPPPPCYEMLTGTFICWIYRGPHGTLSGCCLECLPSLSRRLCSAGPLLGCLIGDTTTRVVTGFSTPVYACQLPWCALYEMLFNSGTDIINFVSR